MELHELVIEMKQLERRLTLYEEKYGILSENFYEALNAGKFEAYDEYEETRVISAGGREYMKHGAAEKRNIRKKWNFRISAKPYGCSPLIK